MPRLTESQVNEIRKAPIGARVKDLAAQYGVTPPTISKIRKGVSGRRFAGPSDGGESVPHGKNLVETLANSIDATAEIIRRTVEKMLNSPDPTATARLLGVVARAQAEITASLANLKHPAMLSWLSKDELREIGKQVFADEKERT